MAEIITPGAAGPLLPPEYQAQIDEARRKQQIAQMMMVQAANNKGPAQIGPVAAKTSPLAGLANMFQSGLGGYMAGSSEQDATKARSAYETDSNADLVKMLGLPSTEQVGYGRVSKFPASQKIADELWKAEEKRRELKGNALSTAGQIGPAMQVFDGGNPGPLEQPTQPRVDWVPDPNNPGKTIPQTTNYDKYKIPKIELGAHGTNVGVDVRLPTEEGKLALSQIGKTLDERRGTVTAHKDILASNNYAIDALEKGAQAGGGEPQKQFIRKALQAFNVKTEGLDTTEQLNMAMGQAILDNAQKIKPVSNTDMENLRQMLGSVNTDPTALVRMIAFTSAAALSDMHNYNKYAEENQKSMNPAVRDLFTGATSGNELPKQLMGPLPYQMEVVRQLQRRGFPIENLADPSGKAFDPASKFDINPIGGMPGVVGKAPGAQPGTIGKPLTVDQLTPAQKAQLRQLLGQ